MRPLNRDARSRQADFNAASRPNREAFTSHRVGVTALLGAGYGRICILGAGNGNDLDLPVLLAAYREVHLVDIDPTALEFAVTSQGVASHPALHLHGGIDIAASPSWSPSSSITASDLATLAESPADRVAAVFPGGFDVVASTCLISQLMETARHALDQAHPDLERVERAILAGHLRLLARLAAPGGTAVLISEVASSSFVPGLSSVRDSGLAERLARLDRDGEGFRWLHPHDLTAAIRSDPVIRDRVRDVTAARPWKWQLFEQCYLVSAITIQF